MPYLPKWGSKQLKPIRLLLTGGKKLENCLPLSDQILLKPPRPGHEESPRAKPTPEPRRVCGMGGSLQPGVVFTVFVTEIPSKSGACFSNEKSSHLMVGNV